MTANHAADEILAIQRLKHGDIAGLEWLVEQYQQRAFQAAFLVVHDEQLAEDIVQDAFLNVYTRIHTFDASRRFQPWFFRSVLNLAITAAQKQANYENFSDRVTLETILAAGGASLEAQVELSELEIQVWDAIQKLSPYQRAVVVRHYFLEMDGEEIALKAGNTVGTVKWLLNAARKKLRGLLRAKGIKHGP